MSRGDFEYRILYLDYALLTRDQIAAKMNDLGQVGWELVALDNDRAYFKRSL